MKERVTAKGGRVCILCALVLGWKSTTFLPNMRQRTMEVFAVLIPHLEIEFLAHTIAGTTFLLAYSVCME